ncbi:hypothetical protein SALBM217S_06726 [Streptomyces griseoloalbus]
METAGEGPGPGAGRPGATGVALTAIGTGAYVVDGRGTIVAVNAAAERLLGRPAAALVGADAHDLLHRSAHGETVPTSQCRMRPAFLAGRPAQNYHDWFEKGDGTLLAIAWSITPYDTGADDTSALVLFHPREAAAEAPGTATSREGAPDELERLALLAETTTQLTSTLSVDEALHRLVTLVLPRLADWAVIDLISERDEVWRTKVVHFEDGVPVSRRDLEGPMAPVPGMTCPDADLSPGPCEAPPRPSQDPTGLPGGPRLRGIAVEQRNGGSRRGMHLRTGERRGPAVAAPVLVLRPPRGLQSWRCRSSAWSARSSRCSPASRSSGTWGSSGRPSASPACPPRCGPTTCSPPARCCCRSSPS